MKIELQALRLQKAVFLGSQYSSMSDDSSGGPPMELIYDTDLCLATCRSRKTGKVVLVPSDNIESMIPKEQKAQADVPIAVDEAGKKRGRIK